MSVDGTNGRLSAHNQRFKELRRKKLERREEKIWNNRFKNTAEEKRNIEKKLDSINPKELAALKLEIQKKARKQIRGEFYTYLISIIVAGIFIYILLKNFTL